MNTNSVTATQYYLTSTVVITGCGGGCTTGTLTRVFTTDPLTCVQTSTCSGAVVCGGVSLGCSSSDDRVLVDCQGFASFPNSSTDATVALSDEYTTAALKTNTIAGLPVYAGFEPAVHGSGQAESCLAISNLSTGEFSYSISRFKWRVVHAPTAGCYLKAWIRKRFRPTGASSDGSGDTITDLDPYEWTGSSDDCLTDPELPIDASENVIYGTTQPEVPEAATNGVTWVEISKYSCVEGYEPDDPLLNGNRPSPDLRSNGFPAG